MKILYSDSHIVVVEKPGGLLSVPGRGPEKQDCVVNRVKNIFPECISQPSVHRLDMDTSGIMVLALSTGSHKNLSLQFMNRTVQKKYIALVDGVIAAEKGKIELPFRLDPENRPYQIYDPVQGKSGTSFWRKIKVSGNTTRIEFTPITGRTHQLRLHASHKYGLGFAILGDRLYGKGKTGDQLMLHSSYISFVNPMDNQSMKFESVPPF